MSSISSLNTLVSNDAAQAAKPQTVAPPPQDAQADASDSQSTYGPPYVLSISDAGQSYLNSDANSSDTAGATTTDTASNDTTATSTDSNSAGAAASAPAGTDASVSAPPTGGSGATSSDDKSSSSSSSKPAGGGGGGGGGGVTVSSDSEETAKRKVRPQVGSVGADEVVDKQGNIDQIKLKELLAQQEAQAHRFDSHPKSQG